MATVKFKVPQVGDQVEIRKIGAVMLKLRISKVQQFDPSDQTWDVTLICDEDIFVTNRDENLTAVSTKIREKYSHWELAE